MKNSVYFFMVIAFVVGIVELIISGILDLIAVDLKVSLGQAGWLITIFALIFAFLSPVLLVATNRIERKLLMVICLWTFLFGNVMTIFSSTFILVFLARIITATSGALLTILCLVMAPKMVAKEFRGRAIGIISMGISGSIVLGIPIGLVLGTSFGWRAPFVAISILTIILIIYVSKYMNRVEPESALPLSELFQSLKSTKLLFALTTTFLYMSGHTALYAYFKPFLHDLLGLEEHVISLIYFIFGIAAVSGGGIGGTIADFFGTRSTIVLSLIIFASTLLVLPYTTNVFILFIVAVIFWGVLS